MRRIETSCEPAARSERELELQILGARLDILDLVFHGNPAAWRAWLMRHGSDAQRAEDLPFVEALCRDDRKSAAAATGAAASLAAGFDT